MDELNDAFWYNAVFTSKQAVRGSNIFTIQLSPGDAWGRLRDVERVETGFRVHVSQAFAELTTQTEAVKRAVSNISGAAGSSTVGPLAAVLGSSSLTVCQTRQAGVSMEF